MDVPADDAEQNAVDEDHVERYGEARDAYVQPGSLPRHAPAVTLEERHDLCGVGKRGCRAQVLYGAERSGAEWNGMVE